jgi:hypothetical protein
MEFGSYGLQDGAPSRDSKLLASPADQVLWCCHWPFVSINTNSIADTIEAPYELTAVQQQLTVTQVAGCTVCSWCYTAAGTNKTLRPCITLVSFLFQQTSGAWHLLQHQQWGPGGL